MTGLYLLHFDTPLPSHRFGKATSVRHYLGFALDIDRRVKEHQKGTGARLTAVVTQAGITFRVVRTWEGGDRTLERKLKNRKNHSQLCPICKGHAP